MIGQTDLARARAAYEAWNRDDFAAWAEFADPDIDFELSGAFPDLDASYRGLEGMQRFWHEVQGMWAEYAVHVHRLLEVGENRILALVGIRARGRDGIMADARFGHVITVRDGVATRLVAYPTWDEALEAVGLPAGTS